MQLSCRRCSQLPSTSAWPPHPTRSVASVQRARAPASAVGSAGCDMHRGHHPSTFYAVQRSFRPDPNTLPACLPACSCPVSRTHDRFHSVLPALSPSCACPASSSHALAWTSSCASCACSVLSTTFLALSSEQTIAHRRRPSFPAPSCLQLLAGGHAWALRVTTMWKNSWRASLHRGARQKEGVFRGKGDGRGE